MYSSQCNRLTELYSPSSVQMDQFEAEMDGLTVKRKRDKDKSERLDQLKHWIEKHRFHIKKLETLLRMLDNNAVDIESVCIVASGRLPGAGAALEVGGGGGGLV